MLDIQNRLPITEQDLQYFKDEWMKTVAPRPCEKKIIISKHKLEWMRMSIVESNNSNIDLEDEIPKYTFFVNDNVITVSLYCFVYRNMGWSCGSNNPSLKFVKMRQSFKDCDTYHIYNRETVFDSELFYTNSLEQYKGTLEKASGGMFQ